MKLSFLPFIVKAVVAALKKHPMLNSALDESTNELVYRKYYNIGIATSTDAGLMVPVVKDADRKSLLDIAREIERVATDAKAGKSKVEDLSGSTFTITSLGAQGGLFATPIINFPEVGILGVHQIKERAVVKDGQIAIGEVMLLSLSFDHRIVDGHVGAAFAYDVIGYLEDPGPDAPGNDLTGTSSPFSAHPVAREASPRWVGTPKPTLFRGGRARALP